ncbi:HesB/IscA family protein [Polycladidibacter stylochi]|uniref:HesB/IscA family protein n=1 Tax=Polycladidibacter stylochi TaxID=1807766 RepID=UPI00082C9B9B|nr:iron-sulfur cluster assembly accessory protein [Pseudovibrio stylochi]
MSNTVTVTESAAKRIATILAKEPEGSLLRISVEGGGCSGFQYKYDIVTTREDDDLQIDCKGQTLVIDSLSLEFMQGAEVDFVMDVMGQSFQINNPNAVAGCGCGTSFAV